MVPPPGAADLVEWFWIPEWDVEPGRVSRQHVVAFPALNLVVEGGRVELVGATTKASHRDLTGRGWAVGALLRPASVAAFIDAPATLRDSSVFVTADDLERDVSNVMGGRGGERHEKAVSVFAAWLIERVGDIEPVARDANRISRLLMSDQAVISPEDAAARLSMSVRTLQRMTHQYVGLPPGAMIRRRRLQEAAERIRDDPGSKLSSLAADLGYVDQAHLTNDFRTVLGITPRRYRGERDGRVAAASDR